MAFHRSGRSLGSPLRARPLRVLPLGRGMTADDESKGRMRLRPTMQQELVFSNSSLPATMRRSGGRASGSMGRYPNFNP